MTRIDAVRVLATIQRLVNLQKESSARPTAIPRTDRFLRDDHGQSPRTPPEPPTDRPNRFRNAVTSKDATAVGVTCRSLAGHIARVRPSAGKRVAGYVSRPDGAYRKHLLKTRGGVRRLLVQ